MKESRYLYFLLVSISGLNHWKTPLLLVVRLRSIRNGLKKTQFLQSKQTDTRQLTVWQRWIKRADAKITCSYFLGPSSINHISVSALPGGDETMLHSVRITVIWRMAISDISVSICWCIHWRSYPTTVVWLISYYELVV